MGRRFVGKWLAIAPGVVLGTLLGGSSHAWAAGPDVSTISQNIVNSGAFLPGLISGLSYALALLFGALGVMKIKDHVENARQTPIQEPLVEFFASGALFALPMIYEAMFNTIGAGGGLGSGGFSIIDILSSAFGSGSLLPTNDINQILSNIVASVSNVPGLLSGASYLLGLVLGVAAILKLKDHVDAPQNTPMREPIIRFLVGGALFALPTVYEAMQTTIAGAGGNAGGIVTDILNSINLLLGMTSCATSIAGSALGGGLGAALGAGSTVGGVVCNTFSSASALPAFLSAAAYLFGLVLGIWGLLKLKDHVLEPRQVTVWEGVSRLIAGGAFFALPTVVSAAQNTLGALSPFSNSSFNTAGTTGSGLDTMLVQFMTDVYGPLMFVINWFGYIAGSILIMIGISRLIESAQEGPRGPGGMGTIMTFLVGGALLSLSPMIGSFTMSLFQSSTTLTYATLSYSTGDTTVDAHVETVISAMLQFMIILGAISFARGLYIIRDVAEGDQQASMMAGLTHLLGGALAINLGPVMNAVQTTLGLTQYGVTFS